VSHLAGEVTVATLFEETELREADVADLDVAPEERTLSISAEADQITPRDCCLFCAYQTCACLCCTFVDCGGPY
jgi:hypothetical protein